MAATLLWFNHDLRLHDNAALMLAAKQSHHLICLYCLDSQWSKQNQYGISRLGQHRRAFLMQTLIDLDTGLRQLGQRLQVVEGDSLQTIEQILAHYPVEHLVRSDHVGSYENRQWQWLQNRHNQVQFHSVPTFTLFTPELIASHCRFPQSFTAFRKRIERQPLPETKATPTQLPPALSLENTLILSEQTPSSIKAQFVGGETSAVQHLKSYFDSENPRFYKETRNDLDGWSTSTKFSPWLANGSISPRRIMEQLNQYETEHGANESTYWIYFELLWREFFQWYANHYGDRLFHFGGIGSTKPLTTFYPQRFKQWCLGQTPWPIVNACMRQLNDTGYISNRGRQLVASCLVNEMQLDWRCGAAYFEEQLIDYEVAANWGNWQYIAGVGADPRGGRHFNLEKQTELYDPEHQFIKRWVGAATVNSPSSLNSVDAADWPIQP